MNGVDRFRKLLDAEREANRRVVESLRTVPESARAGPEFTRALGCMAHNQLARDVWMHRLRGEMFAPVPDWFPPEPIETIERRAAELDDRYARFIDGLADSDLDRDVSYKCGDGSAWVSTVDDILTHVFNHSTYHRGQVARLVTQVGGQRAGTDYVALTCRAL